MFGDNGGQYKEINTGKQNYLSVVLTDEFEEDLFNLSGNPL